MSDERKIIFLDVNDILPNRFQPRIKFNEDSLNELSESIKKYGVIEPIVVRPIGDKYEIIAGERRYKACLLAGLSKVPAVITSLDDKDSAEVALIENVQREDLTPIEEAVSYKKILEMGYMTQEELATKLGKNQGTVANKLRLLNLTEDAQEALLEGKISERHARSLLKLKDDNDQIEMLNNIITNRLTVRKTDEEIEKVLQAKKEQPEIEQPVVAQEEIEVQPQGKEEEKMSEFNPFLSDTGISAIPEFNAFAPATEENAAPAINPGFMDVAKIEETAEDINVEKPQADISSLLTPTDLPEVEIPQVEETPQVEVPAVEEVTPVAPVEEETASKFFTVNPEETQNDEAAFASNLNSFNESQPFNFNFTPVEPKVEETPVMEEIKPLTVEPTINDEPVVIPLAEEESTPVVPVEEVPQVEEPKVEVAPMPEFNFDELLRGIPSVNTEATPIPEVKVDTPVLTEEVPSVEASPVQEETQVNLMKALDLIRDCGKQLEAMGYKVNLDEIDLSNNYQVTFNLEK